MNGYCESDLCLVCASRASLRVQVETTLGAIAAFLAAGGAPDPTWKDSADSWFATLIEWAPPEAM